MRSLNPIRLSGAEVLPVVEGGKGIAVSNGESSGAWALAGGVGTFSGVNPDSYDANGNYIPQHYYGRTRRERQDVSVAYVVVAPGSPRGLRHGGARTSGRAAVLAFGSRRPRAAVLGR